MLFESPLLHEQNPLSVSAFGGSSFDPIQTNTPQISRVSLSPRVRVFPNTRSLPELASPSFEDPDMATVAPAADRILPSFPHLGWRYFFWICSLSSVLLIDSRSGFCLLSLCVSLYLYFIWFDLWVSVGTVRGYENRGRCLVDD